MESSASNSTFFSTPYVREAIQSGKEVNKAEMLLLPKLPLLASSKEKDSVLVVANREGRRRFSPFAC
ncbi:hypothetical protein V6N13_034880 [Hibiscus sabdariffa]